MFLQPEYPDSIRDAVALRVGAPAGPWAGRRGGGKGVFSFQRRGKFDFPKDASQRGVNWPVAQVEKIAFVAGKLILTILCPIAETGDRTHSDFPFFSPAHFFRLRIPLPT